MIDDNVEENLDTIINILLQNLFHENQSHVILCDLQTCLFLRKKRYNACAPIYDTISDDLLIQFKHSTITHAGLMLINDTFNEILASKLYNNNISVLLIEPRLLQLTSNELNKQIQKSTNIFEFYANQHFKSLTEEADDCIKEKLNYIFKMYGINNTNLKDFQRYYLSRLVDLKDSYGDTLIINVLEKALLKYIGEK